MFVYSEIHDWQQETAVKQILVFPNEKVYDLFQKEYALRVEKDGPEKASDSNAGAVYKLKAVLGGDGKYLPVIRCGVTGELLWSGICHPSWKTALLEAYNRMHKNILSNPPAEILSQLTSEVSIDFLIDGRIPAYTACAYTGQCPQYKSYTCKHLGSAHPVPFSCGMARAFQLIQK